MHCRAQVAVTAALLHDVVDDTNVELAEIAVKFGPQVAEIIHHVSRLSDVNQLLRRQLRHEVQPVLQQASSCSVPCIAALMLPWTPHELAC